MVVSRKVYIPRNTYGKEEPMQEFIKAAGFYGVILMQSHLYYPARNMPVKFYTL